MLRSLLLPSVEYNDILMSQLLVCSHQSPVRFLTLSALLSKMAQYFSRSFIQRSLRYSTPSLSRSSRLLNCSYNSIVRPMSSSSSQYEYILVSRPEPSVLLVTLNRPKSLNALSSPLFKELNQALEDADKDDSVGAMVLTGSEKAFAGLFPPYTVYVANSNVTRFHSGS